VEEEPKELLRNVKSVSGKVPKVLPLKPAFLKQVMTKVEHERVYSACNIIDKQTRGKQQSEVRNFFLINQDCKFTEKSLLLFFSEGDASPRGEIRREARTWKTSRGAGRP